MDKTYGDIRVSARDQNEDCCFSAGMKKDTEQPKELHGVFPF